MPTSWSGLELRIFDLTNQARVKARLKPLEREDGLRQAAISHTADMFDRHFFDHRNPSGEGPVDRISRIHRQLVGVTGENIWEGSGDFYSKSQDLGGEIVKSWLNSPGHRANMLRPEFTHLGVGVVVRDLEVRATQDFARVRAYLNVPLPQRAPPGTAVDLSAHGDPPPAEMFDLMRLPEFPRAGSPEPQALAGARLNAPPGKYRLRLYFPTRHNEFEIFTGPSIQVQR